MKNILDQLRNYSLTRSIIYIVLGIVILFAPLAVKKVLFYLISAYLGFFGIMNLVTAFKRKQETGNLFGIEFIIGAMLILLAIINIVFMDLITKSIPIILGVLLILNALIQLSLGASIKEVNPKYRLTIIIYSVMVLIAGITLIFNPFGTDTTMLRVFGTVLVVMGAAELLNHYTKDQYLL
ncbi:hypothetical protein G7081_06450 [Vagococcus coleopterorum]|uniref:Acid-resistance membrane protein n=1 Tax=Vagococcus coleopterorum TaxID=2714946 RepID=A0A6G8ANU3_9ENTE|nr:DUF308 domain-containing protein [Vagococcus coleopterorum]QIL46741.1 hypothetical protein G7081_06450 [Vagococcus coleopterorum]